MYSKLLTSYLILFKKTVNQNIFHYCYFHNKAALSAWDTTKAKKYTSLKFNDQKLPLTFQLDGIKVINFLVVLIKIILFRLYLILYIIFLQLLQNFLKGNYCLKNIIRYFY